MDKQALIREILYRAQHRGLKELDVTLSRLTPTILAEQDEATLTNLRDVLLVVADQDLLNWLLGQQAVDSAWNGGGFALLSRLQRGTI